MSTKPSKPARAAMGKGKKIESDKDFEDSPSQNPPLQQILPTPESKTSSSRQKVSEDNEDTKSESNQSNPDQNILFQEVNKFRQTLKRKELEGNEFMTLQQKDKILKQLEPVLVGFEPIDEPHRTYFLSLIRDITTGYSPVNPKNVLP